MFLNKYLINTVSLIRTCGSKSSISVSWRALSLECLKNRSVLKVSGEDTHNFIQGLITNDMQHLEDGACSMYTMFLNNKGRVMYDAIIYRTPVKNDFLVECDLAATEALKKHMSMFRIRRKIAIDSLSNDVNVWVVFHPTDSDTTTLHENKTHSGRIVPCNTLNALQTINTKSSAAIEVSPEFCSKHNLIVCRDPRLITLGVRVIAPKSVDFAKLAAEEIGATICTDQQVSYKALRYKLGVGEGIEDLPPGNCFPLEANCDYLHGVSFHKGCYIGQELTARTHHTGVVRKRLMPIVFDELPTAPFVPDSPIERSDKNRPLGKLRGVDSVRGLALLRITEALEIEKFKVLNVTAHTMKPKWWPQEAPKDRALAGKDTAS